MATRRLWVALVLLSYAVAGFQVPVVKRQMGPLSMTKRAQKEKANHDKWQPYYERLVKYRESHDSFDKLDDEELKHWLEDQQKQYQGMHEGRKVKLTKKRAVALEKIEAVGP